MSCVYVHNYVSSFGAVCLRRVDGGLARKLQLFRRYSPCTRWTPADQFWNTAWQTDRSRLSWCTQNDCVRFNKYDVNQWYAQHSLRIVFEVHRVKLHVRQCRSKSTNTDPSPASVSRTISLWTVVKKGANQEVCQLFLAAFILTQPRKTYEPF